MYPSETKKNYKPIQNGIPKGSVTSPLLFNAYIEDITDTFSREFTYIDDVALVAQARNFKKLKCILNDVIGKIQKYFYRW